MMTTENDVHWTSSVHKTSSFAASPDFAALYMDVAVASDGGCRKLRKQEETRCRSHVFRFIDSQSRRDSW